MSTSPRLVLTPVVTVGDLDRLKVDAPRGRGVSDLVAAQQVFGERFAGREPPKSMEAIVAALAETEPPPGEAAQRLAVRRVDAVRETLKKAGIDVARLEPSRETEGLEASQGGRVEVALTDRVRPRRNLLAELIQKLVQAMQRPFVRASTS